MDTTSGVRITAAAGTHLTHHLFAKLSKLDKSHYKKQWRSEFPYHAFAHCRGFSTAAPRRARTLISVSFSGLLLPKPVQILGLVSHYLTNSLICRSPILRQLQASIWAISHSRSHYLSGIIPSFPGFTRPRGRLTTCY